MSGEKALRTSSHALGPRATGRRPPARPRTAEADPRVPEEPGGRRRPGGRRTEGVGLRGGWRAARDGQRRGDGGGRGLGGGQARRPRRGLRRPQSDCGTAGRGSGQTDASRGSPAASATARGRGGLSPPLLSPQPARLTFRTRIPPGRRLAGASGGSGGSSGPAGPGSTSPIGGGGCTGTPGRRDGARSLGGAREQPAAPPPAAARPAPGPAPPLPGPRPSPPLPQPSGTCVAAGRARPRLCEPHPGWTAVRTPRAEPAASASWACAFLPRSPRFEGLRHGKGYLLLSLPPKYALD